MPPLFCRYDFEFEHDLIPEHFESEAAPTTERDPSKFWLEYSELTEEGVTESFPLAINIDSLEAAELLKAARVRYLEDLLKPKTDEEKRGILGRVAIRGPETPLGARVGEDTHL